MEDPDNVQHIIYNRRGLEALQLLLNARRKLKIPWGDPSNQDICDSVLKVNPLHIEPNAYSRYFRNVERLWRDKGIRDTYGRRSEFQFLFNQDVVDVGILYMLFEVKYFQENKELLP